MDHALSSAAKGFNGIDFSFLHSNCLSTLDNWHRFSSMYSVLSDRMAIEIPDWFYLVCFPIQLHFIRLHSLLYGFTDVTKAHINTCTLDSSVCGIFNGLK